MSNPVITWTPEMLARFKVAYAEADRKLGGDGVFIFDGHEFVVAYAGYLIEFLDGEFAARFGGVS